MYLIFESKCGWDYVYRFGDGITLVFNDDRTKDIARFLGFDYDKDTFFDMKQQDNVLLGRQLSGSYFFSPHVPASTPIAFGRFDVRVSIVVDENELDYIKYVSGIKDFLKKTELNNVYNSCQVIKDYYANHNASYLQDYLLKEVYILAEQKIIGTTDTKLTLLIFYENDKSVILNKFDNFFDFDKKQLHNSLLIAPNAEDSIKDYVNRILKLVIGKWIDDDVIEENTPLLRYTPARLKYNNYNVDSVLDFKVDSSDVLVEILSKPANSTYDYISNFTEGFNIGCYTTNNSWLGALINGTNRAVVLDTLNLIYLYMKFYNLSSITQIIMNKFYNFTAEFNYWAVSRYLKSKNKTMVEMPYFYLYKKDYTDISVDNVNIQNATIDFKNVLYRYDRYPRYPNYIETERKTTNLNNSLSLYLNGCLDNCNSEQYFSPDFNEYLYEGSSYIISRYDINPREFFLYINN